MEFHDSLPNSNTDHVTAYHEGVVSTPVSVSGVSSAVPWRNLRKLRLKPLASRPSIRQQRERACSRREKMTRLPLAPEGLLALSIQHKKDLESLIN